MTEARLADTLVGEEYGSVPEHLRDGLVGYVEKRWQPGGFLEAVLSNNLREAMGRADEKSREGLFAIVKWLYNEAPGMCWGSPEKVEAWLRRKDDEDEGACVRCRDEGADHLGSHHKGLKR